MPDEEQAFKIEEKKQNCTFDFDLENGEAIVNTSLIYTNNAKVEVSVRECAPSETIAPIPMTAEPNGCSMRHDFGTGVSTEMAMWTYEYEGQLFQASPCITTDTTYTHSKVFDKKRYRRVHADCRFGEWQGCQAIPHRDYREWQFGNHRGLSAG
ncbi:hypothetical protein [Roseibium aggregatum]|uniref:hypothetical protein n=1 Tax=Roseibium aggregatum TaxID=187304 RepID=UPI0025ABFBE0|nr:hypothetical protein [Roseibium aggregatum]WJS05733.1 hypothetical protein QUB73_27280 [Roseibium aggregatum]